MGDCASTRRRHRILSNDSRRSIDEPISAQEQVQQAIIKTQEDQNEYEYLSNVTHFDVATLQLLHTRFQAIDASMVKDSRISLQEFANVVGISSNSILVQRMFDFMDPSQMQHLTFRIFAKTMSIFSREASIDEKLRLSFHLYDLNDDGFIDKYELECIIKDCLAQLKPLHLSDKMIQQIIQNTLHERDKITYLEYAQLIQGSKHIKNNFLLSFSLDVTKLIRYEADERKYVPINADSIKDKTLHHGALQIEAKRSLLKKMDSVQLFDQVIRVKSVHDVTQLHFE
eukprot:301477_1